jgi:hypothetical protein
MNKAYFIGGLALAAVFVAGIMFPRTTVVERVVERVVEQLGAGTSLSTDNLITLGGVNTYVYTTAMAGATNTPCTFRTPNATTTLDYASANIRVATGTAATIGLYVGATSIGTSTATLFETALAANAKQTLVVASSTIMAPNRHVVFGAKGSATGFTYGGSCNVKFTEVGSL